MKKNAQIFCSFRRQLRIRIPFLKGGNEYISLENQNYHRYDGRRRKQCDGCLFELNHLKRKLRWRNIQILKYIISVKILVGNLIWKGCLKTLLRKFLQDD